MFASSGVQQAIWIPATEEAEGRPVRIEIQTRHGADCATIAVTIPTGEEITVARVSLADLARAVALLHTGLKA